MIEQNSNILTVCSGSRNYFPKSNILSQDLNKDFSSIVFNQNKNYTYGLFNKNKMIDTQSDDIYFLNDVKETATKKKESPKLETKNQYILNSPKLMKMQFGNIVMTQKINIEKPLIKILIKLMRIKILSFYFRKFKMIIRCLKLRTNKKLCKSKTIPEKLFDNKNMFFQILKLQEIILQLRLKMVRPSWRTWQILIFRFKA